MLETLYPSYCLCQKMNMYDMGCCVGKWMSDMSHHHWKCITSCVAMPENVCLTCVALSENVCSTRVAISKNVCSTLPPCRQWISDKSAMSAMNFRQMTYISDWSKVRRELTMGYISLSRHVPMSELKVVSADILCRKL